MAGHFSTLIVAVATRIGIRGESATAAATTSLGQRSSKVFYFFLEADVVLLKLADGDRRRREGADLLRGIAKSSLELGHCLLQLKERNEKELASKSP